MKTKVYHKPVMVRKVVDILRPEPGDTLVDGTVGEGGHSRQLLKKVFPGGFIVGIDRDPDMLEVAQKRLADTADCFKLFNNNYKNMSKILKDINIDRVDGILLDLGFSSRHIKKKNRGFSFTEEKKLDMRYDINRGIPVYEWLNNAPSGEIEQVLKKYGQEYEAKNIARHIYKYKKEKGDIMSARELAGIVIKAKKTYPGGSKVHPATKTFQALRIFINNELDIIKESLPRCLKLLTCPETSKNPGRLAVLTYHSLEDRAVKEVFRKFSGKCECPPNFPVCRCGARTISPRIKILKDSGCRPSSKEIQENPSSRSAHLRVCEVIKK